MGLLKKAIRIGSLLLALFLCGCATTGDKTEANLFGARLDQLEVLPDIEKRLPIKVAILPFENLTEKAEASVIVRRAFYNHFSSMRYQDVELHSVDGILQNEKIYEDTAFLKRSPGDLGRMLDTEGLLYGKVTGFDLIFVGAYSRVSVELEASLVKASTGSPTMREV